MVLGLYRGGKLVRLIATGEKWGFEPDLDDTVGGRALAWDVAVFKKHHQQRTFENRIFGAQSKTWRSLLTGRRALPFRSPSCLS